MLELNREQRRILTDKLPDVANIAAGALVFGQFFSVQAFSAIGAAAGLSLWVTFLALALFFARETRQ
jgi:hypothetical protein